MVTVQVIIGGEAPPPPPPADGWTFCASEGGLCAFSGTQQVRYGANGAYFYKSLSGGTPCTNSVFGDPIAGTAKQCHIGGNAPSAAPAPADGWTFCASEGGFCAFSGTQQVRYGANGAYFYKSCLTARRAPIASSGIRSLARSSNAISAATHHRRHHHPRHPPASAVGPQSTITCPAGAVDIWPGVSIQNVVDSYGGNTTFCLGPGPIFCGARSGRRPGIRLSASTARSWTAPAGRRATTRRPRSGRTTKTSTT